MKIQAENLDKREAYRLFTSVIVPRPIAWVTTLNDDGSINAAPFSFFMGVTIKPPRLALSVSSRGDNPKDTARNILRTKEFVVNIVTKSTADAMYISSGEYEYGKSEIEIAMSTSGSP